MSNSPIKSGPVKRGAIAATKPDVVLPSPAIPPVLLQPGAEPPIPAALAATPSTVTPSAASSETAPAAKDITMDEINTTAETMTNKANAMFGEANDRAKGAMEKGQKLFDEMNAFNKGNIEAIVESSKIAARGFETLGQDAAAYAKGAFEQAGATARTLAGVRSPAEFARIQSDYVRGAFDAMIAEGSRSTEAMLKLAGEVAQPISNRVAIAAEKVKIAA